MGKKIMLLMLALFVTPVFAQTNCTEQYSGGYHCLNYETGQSTNIHITPYHGNTVQPLEMPDISTLPTPTSMMQMDNNQTNDLLNPQLSFEQNVQQSPQVQQTLDNIARQQQALTIETSRMAEQANRQQAEFAQQQILLSQQRVQANQQRLAQLEAQKRTNQAMPNSDGNSQISNTQNYIIAGLIALVSVLVFALGAVWQKNRRNVF